MSLADLVQQNISQSEVQNISQQLGTDPGTAQNAINAAIPMMLGGMAHTANQPGGESAIQSAIGALGGSGGSGAGGLGGALGGMLGGAAGGGILGSILGQHHDTVQDGVQKASGLDAGKAGKLLILLAPFVLRALAKHQQATPATAPSGGMAGSLQQEARNAATSAPPQVGGILGKILGGIGG